MASTLSNHLKYMLGTKKIDFGNDSWKACLMGSGFVFNKDTHATWVDGSAEELGAGHGYTQNTKILGSCAVAENDIDDRFDASWASIEWEASGGAIGPSAGLIIYDDTTTDDTILGYIDFVTPQTADDGKSFTVNNVAFRNT